MPNAPLHQSEHDMPITRPSSTGPATLDSLGGKVDRCIARTEVCVLHAARTEEAVVRIERVVSESLIPAMRRLQSDHISLRHGIPASWAGRLSLVGFAAIVGALTATSAIACGARPMAPAAPVPSLAR